jgi:hypothetical protein
MFVQGGRAAEATLHLPGAALADLPSPWSLSKLQQLCGMLCSCFDRLRLPTDLAGPLRSSTEPSESSPASIAAHQTPQSRQRTAAIVSIIHCERRALLSAG